MNQALYAHMNNKRKMKKKKNLFKARWLCTDRRKDVHQFDFKREQKELEA
jgi:hypothetical protein